MRPLTCSAPRPIFPLNSSILNKTQRKMNSTATRNQRARDCAKQNWRKYLELTVEHLRGLRGIQMKYKECQPEEEVKMEMIFYQGILIKKRV